MWSSVIDFLSRSIQFFYEITVYIGIPNYGLALILFTLVLKILLLPLTVKQIRGMAVMQQIQPQIQEIQKKHKNNPQKSQQKMMELYQRYNTNPFSGCWPLLVQIPILIGLFQTLRVFFHPAQHPEYVELENANFLWIENLGNLVSQNQFFFILPALVILATFSQQKLSTPATMEGPQKYLMYGLPFFIGFISYNFPSGLALYWVIFNAAGIVEAFFIRRPMMKKMEAQKIQDEKKRESKEDEEVEEDKEAEKDEKKKDEKVQEEKKKETKKKRSRKKRGKKKGAK